MSLLAELTPQVLAAATDEELLVIISGLESEVTQIDTDWVLQDKQHVAEALCTDLDPTKSHELLYGGAAGGGKSQWMLWHLYHLALQYPGFSGLLLRRTYKQLIRTHIRMAFERFDRSICRYNAVEKTWKFENGSTIEFGFLDTDRDIYNYDSAEYDCVAPETPILMADGSYRAISKIVAGDLVQTLEGPRAVTRCQPVGRKPTVKIETPTGSVVCSLGHRVLDSCGDWVTPQALQPIPLPLDAPTLVASPPTRRAPDTRSACSSSDRQPARALLARAGRTTALLGFAASTATAGTDDATSYGSPREDRPLPEWFGQLTLYGPAPSTTEPARGDVTDLRAPGRARDGSSLPGSPADCRPRSRSGDARSPRDAGDDRARTPSRDDAGEACDVGSPSPGDPRRTRVRSRARRSFRHPYTMEVRPASVDVHQASVRIVPAGERVLWDMTVEGANHYVAWGGSIHANCVAWDELTQWSDDSNYRYLFSRIRTQMKLAKLGLVGHMIAGTNPGRVGGAWVKARFIDVGTPMERWDIYDDDTDAVMTRVFVPATIDDNRFFNRRQYRAGLANLDEKRRRQLELGDWDAIEGQYFHEWNRAVHVIPPFEIPSWWTRIRGIDYGYTNPMACVWIAFDGDGTAYIYRELYGTGMVPTVQARRIATMTRPDEAVAYTMADPSIWAKTGIGPCIAEQYQRAGLKVRRANNERVAGWTLLRQYLRMDETTGRPRLFIFDHCLDTIRTLPMLVHDDHNPEDLDTDGDDHLLDSVRYAMLSRPKASKLPGPPVTSGDQVHWDGLRKRRHGRRDGAKIHPDLGRL